MEKEAIKNMTLEEALEKLDRTVERLQSEDISLEDSFQAYKEGMEYVRFCSKTIDQVEKKILLLNEEGGLNEFSE